MNERKCNNSSAEHTERQFMELQQSTTNQPLAFDGKTKTQKEGQRARARARLKTRNKNADQTHPSS